MLFFRIAPSFLLGFDWSRTTFHSFTTHCRGDKQPSGNSLELPVSDVTPPESTLYIRVSRRYVYAMVDSCLLILVGSRGIFQITSSRPRFRMLSKLDGDLQRYLTSYDQGNKCEAVSANDHLRYNENIHNLIALLFGNEWCWCVALWLMEEKGAE